MHDTTQMLVVCIIYWNDRRIHILWPFEKCLVFNHLRFPIKHLILSNNFHPVCIYQDLLIPFKNHPISFLLITFLHSKWSKVIYTQKACTIGIFYQLHICFLNDAWYTLYIYTCIYLNFRARTACIYITFYSVISFSTEIQTILHYRYRKIKSVIKLKYI